MLPNRLHRATNSQILIITDWQKLYDVIKDDNVNVGV
jgi:hypothetical protein